MKLKKVIYFIFFYNFTFSSEKFFYNFIFSNNKEDEFNELNGILYKKLGKFNYKKKDNNENINNIYYDKNFKLEIERESFFKKIIFFILNLNKKK